MFEQTKILLVREKVTDFYGVMRLNFSTFPSGVSFLFHCRVLSFRAAAEPPSTALLPSACLDRYRAPQALVSSILLAELYIAKLVLCHSFRKVLPVTVYDPDILCLYLLTGHVVLPN